MRWMFFSCAWMAMAAPASAHFLWVVPDATGRQAAVIISETLVADDRVDIGILGGATLSWRDAAGREQPLTPARATAHALQVPLAGTGLVHGHADLGVRPSGERAYRLHYYPKTVVGDAFKAAAVAGKVPIEIVPTGAPGAVRLRVLVDGAPAPRVDVNVLLPDGSETTVQTDADGLTEVLDARGRYGAWARHWAPISGTHNGTAFDQTRYYATLVFDAPATGSASGGTAGR